MSATVFISYRRADTGELALRLSRRIGERFGAERVFLDREDIDHGARWRDAVQHGVRNARTVLALIGPRWLELLHERAAAGDDVLHGELAAALAAGVRVIPVLVDGATLPPAAQLPQDLRGLLECQAAPLRSDRFDDDARALMLSLRTPWAIALRWASANTFSWLLAVAAAGAIIAGLGGLLALSTGRALDAALLTAPAVAGYVAGGAAFGAIVGGAQWLALRPWLPGTHRLALHYALLWGAGGLAIGLAAIGGGSSAIAGAALATVTLVATAMPFVLWLVMHRHIEGAGWFSTVSVAAPMATFLAMPVVWGAGGSRDSLLAGPGIFALLFLGHLVGGLFLVALVRRSRLRVH